MPRIAIVSDDDGHWYVRRIKSVIHDGETDEKVYRCDLPIANDLPSLDEAAEAARVYLAQFQS